MTPSASPPIEPYSSEGYDTFVLNRYDRIIAARGDVDSLGGLDADVTGTGVDGLFDAVLFPVDSPNVAVSVTDPDGVPLRRDVSTFMDRRHSRYHAMRYRYGASPGRYLVTVTGLGEGTYRLEAMGVNAAGRTLDGIEEASIGAGEVHEYSARVRPDATAGTLTRVNRRGSLWWPAVGVGAGPVGLAGAASAGLRCRGSTGGDDPSDPA